VIGFGRLYTLVMSFVSNGFSYKDQTDELQYLL